MGVIDDFEDGDTTIDATGWSGWTVSGGTFSANSSSPIAGSYDGAFEVSNQSETITATAPGSFTADVELSVALDSDTDDAGDVVGITCFRASDSASFAQVEFQHNGDDIVYTPTGDTLLPGWTPGTVYTFQFRFDYANDEVTVELDGTDNGPYAFATSASALERVDIRNATSSSGLTRVVSVDDVYSVGDPVPVAVDSLTETAEGEVRVQASATGGPYDTDGEWRVYRSLDGSQGSQVHTDASDTDLDWTDTSSPTGDIVYYTVARHIDGVEETAQDSLIVRAAAITDLSVASTGDTTVDLSWSDPSGGDIDQVELYRAESAGSVLGDYSQFDTVTDGVTTYTDTGREEGERYYYRVIATNSGDSSYDSRLGNEADGTTTLPAPTIDSTSTSP